MRLRGDSGEMPGLPASVYVLVASATTIALAVVIYLGALVLFGVDNVVGSGVAAAIIVVAYAVGPGKRP